MANELKIDYLAGATLTARIRNVSGEAFHVADSTWETYGAGGHTASSYDLAMTDTGNGAFRGDLPAAINTAMILLVQYWDAAITEEAVGQQLINWGGAGELAPYGVGDHAVTLTIRTTTGTPVAGARVWLSTNNNREVMYCGAQTTDDSGRVTVYCDYATRYYIHCHLSGYQFAAANFTPAAGSVSFTKDIAASVTASGSASDYADSMLVRLCSLVNKLTAEPKLNKLYDDAWIISRAENVYALVLGEIHRMTQDQVIATIPLSILGGQNVYIIPPHMGPIQAVYTMDNPWGLKYFYERRGSGSILGKGIWVEGNMLKIQQSTVIFADTIYVECWPNGCARLHCGTCTVSADGLSVTFGATPYLGTVDRTVNAYAGSIFRPFKVTGTTVTGNVIDERIISSYNAVTRVATLMAPLDPIPTTDDGSIFYEIAPQIPVALDSVIGMRIAWEINSIIQPKKAPGCLAMYQSNVRHLRLESWAKQLQSARQPNADNFNNPGYEWNQRPWPTS
jgi:hypothetical protein